jgi:hypothetical protein
VHRRLSFLLCFFIFPPFPWHRPRRFSFQKPSPWPNTIPTVFVFPTYQTTFRDVTTRYLQCFLTFFPLAFESTQPNFSTLPTNGHILLSSNLIGYHTIPQNLPPLVPSPKHSPNYMFPAFPLEPIITEERTHYSETSVTKCQKRRTTSRMRKGLNISGVYNLVT